MKIYRAGMIPFYVNDNEAIEMMFMKPSDAEYGGDKFQIAKGKIDPGENSKEAAIREAGEELGFTMLNAKGTITHIGTFLGRTEIFIVEVKDKRAFGNPHFETEDTIWMTLHKFLKDGRDLHKPIIKAAQRKMEKII